MLSSALARVASAGIWLGPEASLRRKSEAPAPLLGIVCRRQALSIFDMQKEYSLLD